MSASEAAGTTEIRAYAERVLHGTSLADKLTDPGRLCDLHPGAPVPAPPSPGRPALLPIAIGRPESAPRPGPDALHEPAVRADLLRRFAHHELQALELMAVMLLRFPEANPALRRTLASTLRDEQRHLGLYLERMGELGMPEPEPGSRFFWDILVGVDSLEAFAAGMSLTLEQANLDFLSFWRDAIERVDDARTVAILDEVYRDEIRHVRHGVQVLRASAPGDTLWTAWQQHLRPPLTARRARGPHFDREGRRRAGLSEEFIDRVRAAGASKGRTPKLFVFEPWFESRLAQPGYTPPKRLRALAADLAPSLACLCGEDDVLLTPRAPTAAFLADLAERGWPLPEHREADDLRELEGSFDRLEAWGAPPVRLPTGLKLRHAPRRADWKTLADKAGVPHVLAKMAGDPRLDTEAGIVCRSVEEVAQARGSFGESVLKLPFSTAGRGLRRGEADAGKGLAAPGCVIVEPWRQRVVDLSLQARVTDRGLSDVQLVRFLTTEGGRFRGTVLGGWRRGLPTTLQRFLSDDGRDPRFVQRSLTMALRMALQDQPDYRGPIGIDAFVCRIGDRLALRPLVEINPRTTFGRVGLAVERRLVARGQAGVWLHLTRGDLGVHPDFRSLAAVLPEPVGTLLRAGALATTDPRRAEVVWTVLIAAESVGEALAILRRAQAGG